MISSNGAQTIGPTSGGKVTAVNNVGTTAEVVLAANQYRASLLFHNPGTVTVYVAPTFNAEGAALSPTLSALGGTFEVLAGGYSPLFTGEMQGPWQAFAASGASNPLTIIESNV